MLLKLYVCWLVAGWLAGDCLAAGLAAGLAARALSLLVGCRSLMPHAESGA